MKGTPIFLRDFSRGVYRKSSVSESLVPTNSVSHSLNINYDEIIGKAKVRAGTTLLGSVITANATPLVLSEYLSSDGSTYKNMITCLSGATSSTVFYYDTSWKASDFQALNNTSKKRTAMLGNQMFMCDGTNMKSSSTGGSTWGTTYCIITDSVTPTLLMRSKARMLASGASAQSRSRVYFSSIIDPTTTPGTITWSTNATTGDYMDVNPDDGDYNTALAETSNITLVFKTKGMYRLDVVSKTVDTQNVYNIGAVSQEAVVNCRGVVYFFSGTGIFRTAGDLPEEISRLGVQDWIDAIPQANWSNVCSGTDDRSVWFSIGDITLNQNQNDQKTYYNVVLKFSIRDESWSIHSYAKWPLAYSQYTNSSGRKLRSADESGAVQTVDLGTTDNTTPIYYELETQEQECGNRATIKKIADKVVVFSKNNLDSQLQAREGDGNYKDIGIEFDGSRVYIGEKLNLEDYYFTFRWFGESTGTPPVLEGLYIVDIEDRGITKK